MTIYRGYEANTADKILEFLRVVRMGPGVVICLKKMKKIEKKAEQTGGPIGPVNPS